MHSVGMLALVAGMPLTYTVRDCGTRRGTLYDTGFLPSTLQTAWDKYSGAVGNVLPPTRSDHKRIVWWYLYLMWAHRNHDPRGTGFDGVGQGRFRQWFSTMSADLFNDQVLKVGGAFAAVVEEVAHRSRSLRDNPYNHAPWFRRGYYGIVDTFPVYVTEPTSWLNKQLLYQPKYDRRLRPTPSSTTPLPDLSTSEPQALLQDSTWHTLLGPDCTLDGATQRLRE